MGGLAFGSRDASGLHYRRNRFYDAEQGRFTQEDPIGMAGGINVYGFANGDPVTYSDPYGLSAEECCPKWLVDGVAGFGDAVSFGLAGVVRRNTPGGDGVDYESGAYTAGTVAGIAVGTATGVGVAANAGRGANVASGTARARQLGAAGEAAVGLARNTTRIPSLTRPGTYRIPDGLSPGVISEVKNVAQQGLTRQLRDYMTHAQANGMRFDLYVRRTTELTRPLQNAVQQGLINLRYIP
jgi:RHS repeat-associated protein